MERLPEKAQPPAGEVWVTAVMIEFVGWRWRVNWCTSDDQQSAWTAESVVTTTNGQSRSFEGARLPVMAYRGSVSFSGQHGNRVALIVGEDRS